MHSPMFSGMLQHHHLCVVTLLQLKNRTLSQLCCQCLHKQLGIVSYLTLCWQHLYHASRSSVQILGIFRLSMFFWWYLPISFQLHSSYNRYKALSNNLCLYLILSSTTTCLLLLACSSTMNCEKKLLSIVLLLWNHKLQRCQVWILSSVTLVLLKSCKH